MKSFALINEKIVENIVVAETKEVAEEISGLVAVELNGNDIAHIGLGFDGKVFEQPPVVDPPIVVDVSTDSE
jgi:hypothetical protein